MTTDNVTNWTGLRDELTPEQIAMFTDAGHRPDEELLDAARHYASQNMLQKVLAHIATPDGAVETSSWYGSLGSDEPPTRTLYGQRWCVGNVKVRLIGEQSSDGTTTWQIEFREVEGTNGDVDSGQARELAQVLIDAADRLDQLNG